MSTWARLPAFEAQGANTNHLRLILVAFLLPAAATWFLWDWHQKRQEEKRFVLETGCLPPKTWRSTWPLGLDMLAKAATHARRKTILQFFLDVVDENGITFEQKLLGARGIDTIDPKNIETVLSTKFSDYGLGLRSPTFRPLLGSGIFTQDGAQWRHSRDLLRPQFASNRYQNFEHIQGCVQDLIRALPRPRAQGAGGATTAATTVDLQPLFFRLTFDTTMFLLFGDSVIAAARDRGWEQQVAGQESSFAQAFNLAQDYLAHRGRLGPFYWLLNDGVFRDACRRCHRFVDGAVDKALRVSAELQGGGGGGGLEEDREHRSNYVFIDALAQQTQDRRVLRDQCFNVLLAGRDTTGCCLSWTFRLLARHQGVLKRLREEIAGVCGLGEDAGLPSREVLKRLPHLHLVIKEVLRLYPSVPVNSREAVRTTILPNGGGPDGRAPLLVRKGEAVGYCVYAMHRRKDIYGEDANEFRPERWENDALKNIGWAYLPFNNGPRLCLGQEFALLEVAYTVCRLVQLCPNIEVPESEPHVEVGKETQTLTLVVACADGCRVSLSH